jgi:hypothetical protein
MAQAASPADEVRARPRVERFTTITGLEELSGCQRQEFLNYIVSQLAETAFDKDSLTRLEVTIRRGTACSHVTPDSGKIGCWIVCVEDTGREKFSDAGVDKVRNLALAPSSKLGLHLFVSGAKGNALQIILGISQALWQDAGLAPPFDAFVLRSGGYEWALGPIIDYSARKIRRKVERARVTAPECCVDCCPWLTWWSSKDDFVIAVYRL